jgi:hypothetical protein
MVNISIKENLFVLPLKLWIWKPDNGYGRKAFTLLGCLKTANKRFIKFFVIGKSRVAF